MQKPTSNQKFNLVEYAWGCNERIQAPTIRFLLNYMSIKDIMKELKLSRKKFDFLLAEYQTYFIISFNQTTLKIECYSYLNRRVMLEF